MSQPSLICDKHNEWQGVRIQNAAPTLLLLQVPIYKDKDITKEKFSSKTSLGEKDKKHKAPITNALEEKMVFKYICKTRTLAKTV